MVNRRMVEIIVGVFIALGFIALFLLALNVSGISEYSSSNTIKITASFDNIGDLKVRAPVKIAGVRIGEVDSIILDKKTFRAKVTMMVDKRDNNIPEDSSASVLSASLLGSNYVEISPGFSEKTLHAGDEISETHSAVILENLLGQAIFKPEEKEGN